jgi:DNA polymerase-1
MEFLLADFSQIELRLAAHFMSDAEMTKTLVEGGDLHRDTAAAMYGIAPETVTKNQRAIAKIMNFSILYGAGARRVTETLRYGAAGTDALTIEEVHDALRVFGVDPPMDEEAAYTELAKQLLEAFHTKRPLVQKFLHRAAAVAKQHHCVYTAFGLRIPIPPPTYSAAYGRYITSDHKAGNAVIQGTAAGLMKATIVRASKMCHLFCAENGLKMWKDIQIILTIHDELIFQVPNGVGKKLAAFMDPELSRWPQFSVPIVLEYALVPEGSNWADKKGFELAAA